MEVVPQTSTSGTLSASSSTMNFGGTGKSPTSMVCPCRRRRSAPRPRRLRPATRVRLRGLGCRSCLCHRMRQRRAWADLPAPSAPLHAGRLPSPERPGCGRNDGGHAFLHDRAAHAGQDQQGHHQQQHHHHEQCRALLLRADGGVERVRDAHSLFLNATTCISLRVINWFSTPPARLSSASSPSSICTAVTLLQSPPGGLVSHAPSTR